MTSEEAAYQARREQDFVRSELNKYVLSLSHCTRTSHGISMTIEHLSDWLTLRYPVGTTIAAHGTREALRALSEHFEDTAAACRKLAHAAGEREMTE